MAKYAETAVEVRGCKVHVRRAGAGAPLLFLHGAGGLEGWLPFLEDLSKKFDVIAPDHPGFGLSDTPEWLDAASDLGWFYLDFIDALQLRGVHLVGHSIGGWIAAELAARNTARLASLVLASSAGIRVRGVPMGDIYIWGVEERLRNLFHDQKFAEERLAVQPTPEQIEILLKNQIASAKLGWQPRLHNPQLRKWLHRIDVPTLVLSGDDDKVFPLPYAEAFQQLIPGARKQVLSGCGHLLQAEKPREFVEAITAFVAEAVK